MTFRLFVLAALLASVAGCYRSEEPLAADVWADAITQAYCEAEDECPNRFGVPRGTPGGIFTRGDVGLCVTHGSGATVRRLLEPWVRAVEAGDASLDGTALAGCLAAIHDATCDARVVSRSATASFPGFEPFATGRPGVLGYDERCDAVFARLRPPVPDDAPCDGPLDCEEGSFCGATEVGTVCRPYTSVGTPCAMTLSDDCFGPGLLCVEGRCAEVERRRSAPPGARCGVHDGVDERCAPGAACLFVDLSGTQTCVATAGEGASCAIGPCAGPLLCARTETSSVCRPLARSSDDGAVCAGYPDGEVVATCDPRAGLRCTSLDESAGVCAVE